MLFNKKQKMLDEVNKYAKQLNYVMNDVEKTNSLSELQGDIAAAIRNIQGIEKIVKTGVVKIDKDPSKLISSVYRDANDNIYRLSKNDNNKAIYILGLYSQGSNFHEIKSKIQESVPKTCTISTEASVTINDPYTEQKNEELLKELKEQLTMKTVFYTQNAVDYILAQLADIDISHIPAKSIMKEFRKEPLLALQTKKELGINTRQKVNADFFSLLTEEGKHQEYVLYDLEVLIHKLQTKITGKYTLLHLKSFGVKKVRILAGNEYDCPTSKKYKDKVFSIDDVPELPLKECTSDYCPCCYLAVSD